MHGRVRRRFGLGKLLVVCLIAAAGVAVLRAVHEDRVLSSQSSDELVTFSVTWEPNPRVTSINIRLMAGDTHTDPYEEVSSPFIKKRMLPPGAPVALIAFQKEPGDLTCYIQRAGKMIAGPKSIGTFGVVDCRGVV